MNILLTGGTGFIGSHLVPILLEKGHQLTLLSRKAKKSHSQPQQAVKFVQTLANFSDLNEFDAVINLAGEPIFDKRWTEKQKQKLFDSRVKLTNQLADLFAKSTQSPAVFISSSATGFYGDLPTDQSGTEKNAFKRWIYGRIMQTVGGRGVKNSSHHKALSYPHRYCVFRTRRGIKKDTPTLSLRAWRETRQWQTALDMDCIRGLFACPMFLIGKSELCWGV